jgi:hypothetical protein
VRLFYLGARQGARVPTKLSNLPAAISLAVVGRYVENRIGAGSIVMAITASLLREKHYIMSSLFAARTHQIAYLRLPDYSSRIVTD